MAVVHPKRTIWFEVSLYSLTTWELELKTCTPRHLVFQAVCLDGSCGLFSCLFPLRAEGMPTYWG